jgi:hypothetical protein
MCRVFYKNVFGISAHGGAKQILYLEGAEAGTFC